MLTKYLWNKLTELLFCQSSYSLKLHSKGERLKRKNPKRLPIITVLFCFFFAKRMQKESTKLNYSAQKKKMLSLSITSCFNSYCTHPAGTQLGFHRPPVSLFLWISSHLSPKSGSSSSFQRPPTLTSLGGDHRQYASQKAQVPVTQLSSLCGICKWHNHWVNTNDPTHCALKHSNYWSVCKTSQVHYGVNSSMG